MTQIERRQARLADIRATRIFAEDPDHAPASPAELSPDCRYHIGSSQNVSLDLTTFFVDTGMGTIHQDKYLVVRRYACTLVCVSLTRTFSGLHSEAQAASSSPYS